MEDHIWPDAITNFQGPPVAFSNMIYTTSYYKNTYISRIKLLLRLAKDDQQKS